MTKRKIVLLSLCGVLLCIYIIQLALALRSPVKNKTLSAEVDKLVVTRADNSVELTKIGSTWVAGDKKYPANEHVVNGMVNAIKDIKILDTVAKAGNGAIDERYELNEENVLVVTAYESEKIVRTIAVGKISTTGSHSYILLDDSRDICLVTGRLHDTFDKTVDDLRSKSLYTLDASSLTAISQTTDTATISIEKSGEPPLWSATNAGSPVDSERAASWASSLATTSVSSWLEDDFTLPEKSVSTTSIHAGNVSVSVTLYKTGDGDDVRYYGTCSETPYKFELSQYTAGKFMKTLADLSSE